MVVFGYIGLVLGVIMSHLNSTTEWMVIITCTNAKKAFDGIEFINQIIHCQISIQTSSSITQWVSTARVPHTH